MPEEREQVSLHATMTQEMWQGPLPSPKTMQEYRDIGNDWPERIVAQWETESAHRRAYEMHALKSATRRDFTGQLFAGAFALSALAVAAFALHAGHPWIGAIIGGGTIGSVVGAFLYQRHHSQT